MNRRKAGGAAPRPRMKRERTPELFFNRELSWLAFNERVAEEAADKSNPLLERAKFAAIVASNLDEFFMVRVARLRNAIEDGDAEHSQKVQDLHVTAADGSWLLEVEGIGDLAMERMKVEARADLFHDVFGRSLSWRGSGVQS